MEGESLGFATAKGPFGAAAGETGQLQRRIVSIAVPAQHIPDFALAQAEIVQEALVEIGEAVRGKTIAHSNAKGSEPAIQASETRSKRPGRFFNGKVEVEIEDPIVRAHGYLPFSGHEKTVPSATADR